MHETPSGFTLPEAVTVLAVAGVLLALALPSFMQVKHQMQARATSHQLSTSLASARQTAVMRNTSVAVCPASAAGICREDGIWDEGWLVFHDRERLGRPALPADILQHVVPGSGLRVRSGQARSQVRFLPDGRSSGSNLTIRVCSGHRKVEGRSIIVSNAGRPRAEGLPANHPECADA